MDAAVLPRPVPADGSSRSAHLGQGLWRLADPKVTLASIAGLVLGTAMAAADGPLHWGWWSLTVLGVWCVEVAKNAWGDVVDHDTGCDLGVAAADRSPFSGGKRVLLDRLLTRRATRGIAVVCYALAIVIGLAIVSGREASVLWLGLGGLALAHGYHAAPIRLSYRGLGELAVCLAYGPGITVGTYLVQRQDVSGSVVALSIPLGLAIAAFLWINEVPDHNADAACGKRTLVVRAGRPRAVRWFGVLVLLPYGVLIPAALLFGAPGALVGLIGSPVALAAAVRARRASTIRELIPAQALTLVAFLLLALGSAGGLWMW